MVRALLILLPLALTLFTFVDCAMRDDSQIKKIPKWVWLLVILFLQPIGGIVYLVIGRGRRPRGPKPGKKRILPPDDDPDFLRSI
ncbi:MAG: hypothetical protein RLZZ120_47 [Actinomycetota bacterium]|jgi:hypothetical protein